MRGFYLLIIILVFVAGVFYTLNQKNITVSDFFFGTRQVISVGDIQLEVEVADTPESRKQGLSGRGDLGSSVGLLMVFDKPDYYGIWMKDMNFSIDIIWISKDLQVVEIMSNVRPETYPSIFEPSAPALYVLETKSGFAQVYGLRTGDSVSIPESILE